MAGRLARGVALALLLVGVSAWAARAQAGMWTVLATMRVPQQEGAFEALDGRIYAVGGFTGLVTEASSLVQAYDVATDSWSQVASLPEALHHPAAAAVGDRLYVVGGFYGTFAQREPAQAVWAYDPATDQWARRASLPTARGAPAAVALDGRLYAIGGERRMPGGGPDDYESVADVAAYDPAADRWETLPPLHHPRNHLAAAVIDGRIYAVGGRDGTSLLLTDLEEYDPATGDWRERAAMPTGRSGHAAAALAGRLYVFGGEGNTANPRGVFAEVEAYDPATDSWTLVDTMPTPRHGLGAVAVGDRIYLPGGSARQGGFGYGRTALLDAYTPD
ncbi:MAG TPA: kelch repeat-containing protein [Chloroflexota bacterium]|nr:kelch repeat-containing protein [Chloroflexota bacterium]